MIGNALEQGIFELMDPKQDLKKDVYESGYPQSERICDHTSLKG